MVSLTKKKIYLSNNIFLYLAYLSLALISGYGAALSFDVPFPAILIFILFLSIYMLLNVDKIRYIGCIPYLLAIRLGLFTLNAFILKMDTEILLEQIVTTFLSIVIFICFYNFGSKNNKEIKFTLLIFSLITSVQICVGLIGKLNVGKGTIVAGIGESNYAATFLLLCISYLLFSKVNKLEAIIVVFDIFVLLLTQSFGAYIALLIVFCIYLKKCVNWKKHNLRRIALLVLFTLAIIIVIALKTNVGQQVTRKLSEKIGFLLQGNFKGFGASRLEVYKCSWNNFTNHFLLGSIENPTIVKYGSLSVYTPSERSHNFILESLVLYGLLGTILNCIVLYIIVTRGKIMVKKYPNKFPLAVAVFIAFVHGLVEPNLFTMHFELFFWLLVGALLSGQNRKATN